MVIVIPTSGESLASPIDARFGRAARFLVWETESEQFKIVENTQNLQAAQGAGVQSAETVAGLGAKVLISGQVGPKAFRVLQAANVAMFASENTTVGEALEAYKAGKLTKVTNPTVGGHW